MPGAAPHRPTQWDTDRATDLRHWCKFAAFAPFRDEVTRDGGYALDLGNYSHVFMRWKERFFVNVRTAPPYLFTTRSNP